MVEAAIWLLVQGDKAGAEDLLAQALRLDPNHERARAAMKQAGAPTSPGAAAPLPPLPNSTVNLIPPGIVKISEATPQEPTPALVRGDAIPPGLTRKTLPGTGAPGDLPFASTPSYIAKSEERTDRHLTLVPKDLPKPSAPPKPPPTTSSTQPQLDPVRDRDAAMTPPAAAPSAPRVTGTNAALGKSWSLEVLTGPHVGTSIPVAKRSMLIGKGLGVLDVEDDFFMATGHASFFQRGGELWISDGGSASGTWVSIDGPHRLNVGDSFSVGLQRLRYLGPLDTAPAEQPWPYGAPRPAASWRLEHVLVGARPGRTWVLRGVVTVGRLGAMVSFPEDDTMSSTHAELRPAGNALEVLDRSVRAGTFAMLPSSGERKVVEGTRIRLGSTVFRVISR